MKPNIRKLTNLVIGALALVTLSTAANAQIRAYRVSDQDVQTVIFRIESSTDRFKNQISRALDRSNIDGTRQEDEINRLIGDFEQATNRLRNNFAARRSTAADVQEVLNRGALIDRFMRNNRLTNVAETTWTQIRNDLNTLAGYYSVTANWNYTGMPVGGTPVYRASDQDVRGLIMRLENSTDRFRNQIGRSLNRSDIDGTRREDNINSLVASFEEATNRLRDNFAARRSTTADVQEVLNRGALIDRFMRTNRMSNPAENTWSQIRADLTTLASYYSVTPNWNYVGAVGPGREFRYNVSDAQMRLLLNRMRQRTSDFRTRYNRWNNPFRRIQTGGQDLTPHINELDRSLNAFLLNFSRAGSRDLEEVFRHAAMINNQLATMRVSADLSNRWNLLRTDFETLAGYYGVTNWNWNNPTFDDGLWAGGGMVGGFDSQLTGTYRLNRSLSDNVNTVVDRAIINARYNNQRDRLRRTLERRLMSPETIMIEKRGSQIMMSTATGEPVSFTADGRSQTETSPNGRTVTTRVITNDRELSINYEGDRMNDYFVSFSPMANGQLRVTRRVYIENDNETVTVTSVYDKISSSPQWSSTAVNQGWVGGGNVQGFIIPNNTTLIASLNTQLSTRTSRDGDQFTMTVDSPNQYRGAIIEGRVIGERSGVITGRANMSLTFDTIRMPDGRTYQFAGIVNQVRETDGDLITVNNEGAIRDNSQTTRTVTRAGIGAVLGAIIGAIAGGGEGAAIGAGIGAGAGAGTVILQGRDNLEIEPGAQFTITATAPASVGVN